MMNNQKDSIYENMNRKNMLCVFFLGVLIGTVYFLAIYGIRPLNVCDDSWLLSGGDLSQHYFGWCFYRNSSWQYPIGMIDGLMYPDKLCITYTDSIPLFAIVFKVLSPILPKTFQYFGLWGIFSYMMLGGLSSILIRKVTPKWYLCGVGSTFFVMSPYVLQRMFKHTSLAGQWIIIAALIIVVYKPFFNNFRRQLTAWAALLFIAAFTHIYFVPMVAIFMFGFCVEDVLANVSHIGKSFLKNLCLGICSCIPALIGLKLLGSFDGTSNLSADGLGEYSANLNVLFNPQGYAGHNIFPILKSLQTQYEGFGYLGAGIILLAISILFYKIFASFLKKKLQKSVPVKDNSENKRQIFVRWIKKHAFAIAMIIVSIIFIVFALSPIITWGDQELMTIHYPGFVIKIWSMFRATGRFVWCIDYIIFTWALMGVMRIGEKIISMILLFACFAVQVYDLMPLMSMSHYWSASLESTLMPLNDEHWNQWADQYKHIQFMPYNVCLAHQEWMFSLADYAKDHHMTLNYYVSARSDFERLEAVTQEVYAELSKGEGQTDTLYIFMDEQSAKDSHLNIYNVDGMFVGTTD